MSARLLAELADESSDNGKAPGPYSEHAESFARLAAIRAAAGLLIDPEDAGRFADIGALATHVDPATGAVDPEAAIAAVLAVADAKPYLVADTDRLAALRPEPRSWEEQVVTSRDDRRDELLDLLANEPKPTGPDPNREAFSLAPRDNAAGLRDALASSSGWERGGAFGPGEGGAAGRMLAQSRAARRPGAGPDPDDYYA